MQDDADNQNEEDNSLEARTRQSLVSPERSAYAAGTGAAAATTAAQALAIANQALLANNRASFGMGPSPTAGSAGTDPEGDAFGPSMFSSPFSAVPAATRGRLQTYTQGILPASYTRQASQNYCCLEGGQVANSAIELQRSRYEQPQCLFCLTV